MAWRIMHPTAHSLFCPWKDGTLVGEEGDGDGAPPDRAMEGLERVCRVPHQGRCTGWAPMRRQAESLHLIAVACRREARNPPEVRADAVEG